MAGRTSSASRMVAKGTKATPSPILRLQLGGDLQGEPRLADTAGTGQGEQRHGLPPQQIEGGAQLALPPQQGRARMRQQGDKGTRHRGHPKHEPPRIRGRWRT